MMISTTTRTISCPRCGGQFELGEAYVHQLVAPIRAEWEVQTRQQVLAAQRAERDELQGRLTEREAEIKALRTQEAELLRDRRKLEDDKEDLERAKERMRDEIRTQERADAEKRAQEAFQEKLRRKDEETRQLEDKLKRVGEKLEEAQRRSGTGSPQQEGIARQDLFAEELQRRFPADVITVTPRGKRGADVTQVVRAGRRDCGVIQWECKRTAAWNAEWSGKLAGEVGRSGARFGVIVSEVLPAGIDGSGQAGGVWACDYDHAWDLAAGFRQAVLAVYRYVTANAGRADIAGKVYDYIAYIATGGFEARYKATEGAVAKLRQEIGQDQRVTQQRCKRMEQSIDVIWEEGFLGIVLDIISLGRASPSHRRARAVSPVCPTLPDRARAAVRAAGMLAIRVLGALGSTARSVSGRGGPSAVWCTGSPPCRMAIRQPNRSRRSAPPAAPVARPRVALPWPRVGFHRRLVSCWVPPGRIHRRRDPPVGPGPAAGDLGQRPPRRRHRRHQPEQLHLGPLEPEGPHAGRGPPGQADGKKAGPQRARIGQHVTGVGQQRERIAGEGHDDLEDQEADDQSQRDRDVAAIGARRDAVAVLVRRGGMAVLALPGLGVISVAAGHAPSRSGRTARVCRVWVRARSSSIRTWASSSR